jgi:uncharacterized protein (UPF0332 family)
VITEELRELIRYRMEQAHDTLRAAEALINEGLLRDSVNRSYYAMFYAVLAILATKGLGTSKHSGAISLFDRDFVKAGLFSKDLSVWIHGAFERRLETDYADSAQVTREEAISLLQEGRDFVKTVMNYLGRSV